MILLAALLGFAGRSAAQDAVLDSIRLFLPLYLLLHATIKRAQDVTRTLSVSDITLHKARRRA